MQIIKNQFPELDQEQLSKLKSLNKLYTDWNAKINVISRKDMEHFNERHLLHSLSLLLFVNIPDNKIVMDLGTGGGFPGLPLAIARPNTQFLLVDSIKKKLTVVKEICSELNIDNVSTHWGRSEEMDQKYDIVICRAVARLTKLIDWSKFNYTSKSKTLFALKGGNLEQEIIESKQDHNLKEIIEHKLSDKLTGDFFETKRLLEVNY